ncbi:MAG TPA: hypothetical protein PKV16_04785 [Caldisericia bacterium]|nr:hypothetical protein [Caldisericia bacterium]HPF48627.1 hypothetical protein [Caldisericia bacterium]HPI83713.1 hypothetical protein [Caldisericia bacterium]HPQ93082.1 hypothetical protein [Caldisericia bacterium]HRV75085.1 hypothetical protein [Caldisericia bacterium]
MSDETMRLWLSDLSKRIDKLGSQMSEEFRQTRSLLHSPTSCPTTKMVESQKEDIERLVEAADTKEQTAGARRWEAIKELLKATLAVLGAVAVAWLLVRLGVK